MNRFYEFIEITYNNLTIQLENWLKELYNKSNLQFSKSSPYGMILHIQKILFSNNILYLKNAIKQIDIETTDNERMIKNIARISGHNPSRSISATGTLKLKLKVGVNINEKIRGGKISIMNNTLLKNKTNQLNYILTTGDSIKSLYDVDSYTELYFNVKQGKYEEQSYTGDGEKNKSISVVINRDQTIDNFNFSVYYNGINLKIVDSLYDMLPNEYACYTRTGFNGGLDIYFGTGNFGFVPEIGSIIKVTYLLTDGREGNILNNKVNDFTFEDDIYDSEGNALNMEDLFDVYIHNDINFGVDSESVSYMKSVIPHVSRNFVLASPEQFIYHLKRLNMFSKVNAFNLLDENNFNNNKYIEKFIIETFGENANIEQISKSMVKYFPTIYDNQIYLYLIPKIRNYFIDDYNYFNVPMDVFYLDNIEKEKIMNYLRTMGILSITSNVTIIQPKISLYVINVYIRRYQNDIKENIKNQIIEVISDYFIDNERFDRIIKSDIIKTIKNEIRSIDSVNIEFISKKNEDYHREGMKSLNTNNQNVLEDEINIIKNRVVYKKKPYNKDVILGLDGVQGDIVVGKDELPVLRGGWYDRNGVYYNDIPTTTGSLNSINIIWTGTNENILNGTDFRDNNTIKTNTNTVRPKLSTISNKSIQSVPLSSK